MNPIGKPSYKTRSQRALRKKAARNKARSERRATIQAANLGIKKKVVRADVPLRKKDDSK